MVKCSKKKSHDETQFTTKIGEKNSIESQLFLFVKFSFPLNRLMPYYAKIGCFHPLIA
jgi:hypothetical protein